MMLPLSHEEHLIEVLDEQGKVLKVKRRSDINKLNDVLKTVYVFVCNSKGELLLTILPHNYKVFQNQYGPSASGIVRYRESPEHAALRTVKRELRISDAKLQDHGTYFYNFGGLRHFATCFSCVHDGDFHLNPEDIRSGDFLDFETIDELMHADRRRFSPIFLQLYDKFNQEFKKNSLLIQK